MIVAIDHPGESEQTSPVDGQVAFFGRVAATDCGDIRNGPPAIVMSTVSGWKLAPTNAVTLVIFSIWRAPVRAVIPAVSMAGVDSGAGKESRLREAAEPLEPPSAKAQRIDGPPLGAKVAPQHR